MKSLGFKEVTDLARAWTIGNKYRKASLIRQYDLKPVNKNGKIRTDIYSETEKDKNAIIPGLDDDGVLVFVMGFPPVAYNYKEVFTTPKATKNVTVTQAKPIIKTTATTTARQTVKGKKKAAKAKKESINYRKEILLRIDSVRGMSNEVIGWFLDNSAFTIHDRPSKIKEEFDQFMSTIKEKLQYKIVAVDEDGNEFETDWQENEEDLAPLQNKLENEDKWNIVDIVKKFNNGEEDDLEKSSIKLRKVATSNKD